MIAGLQWTDLAIAVGTFLLLVMGTMLLRGGQQARMQKRIERLKQRKAGGGKTPASAEQALQLRRKGEKEDTGWVANLIAMLPNLQGLSNRLERAGSKLSARQFLFRCLLAVPLFVGLFYLIGKPPLIGLFVGFILCVWLPLKILGFKINGEKKKFLKVFPDAIDLIVRGLRSGLPVSESVKLVASEVPAPVGSTFDHVANTMKLGVSMEGALQEVAKKLDYTEFNFFVTSIVLQRETGGNLSEILNNLADVLRKRAMMGMKIKAMTSEARASSMIIGAMPFLVISAVGIMTPSYLAPLFSDVRGNIAAASAAGMLFTGVWTMNRMAKFEI